MKELIDGTKVSDRSYYYLLDWNEVTGWKYILTNFDTHRLCELKIDQYKQLFAEATRDEFFKM